MVINTEIPSIGLYRIGPGTYVPLMFDPTGGGAWCAALCGAIYFDEHLSFSPSGCYNPYRPDAFESSGGGEKPTSASDICIRMRLMESADGDPTVERAVVDPIGRLGRVALPSVCASDRGLDGLPLSDIFYHQSRGCRSDIRMSRLKFRTIAFGRRRVVK